MTKTKATLCVLRSVLQVSSKSLNGQPRNECPRVLPSLREDTDTHEPAQVSSEVSLNARPVVLRARWCGGAR